MLIIDFLNKIASRYGMEIISKRDLDKLIYSSSHNREINKVAAEESVDPFDDQKYLIKAHSPIIFDVGAYVGDVTCKYDDLFPAPTIHAFEPTVSSYYELEKRAHSAVNIHIHNYAVSNTNGKSKFHINRFAPTNSLLASSDKGKSTWGAQLLETDECIFVKCLTIDQFCRDNSIEYIDIMKLDVQGNELDVLTGAQYMLGNEKINLIYTEMLVAETYKRQSKLSGIMQIMDDSKFRLFNIYNLKTLNRQLIQADVIFVHQNLL